MQRISIRRQQRLWAVFLAHNLLIAHEDPCQQMWLPKETSVEICQFQIRRILLEEEFLREWNLRVESRPKNNKNVKRLGLSRIRPSKWQGTGTWPLFTTSFSCSRRELPSFSKAKLWTTTFSGHILRGSTKALLKWKTVLLRCSKIETRKNSYDFQIVLKT